MSKSVSGAVVKTIRIDWDALPSAAAVAVHPPKFPAFEVEAEAGAERREMPGEGSGRAP
jgi:hypothetical protein